MTVRMVANRGRQKANPVGRIKCFTLQKFRELTGYNKKVIDCVLVSRMRRPEGYQGYKIIPLKQ